MLRWLQMRSRLVTLILCFVLSVPAVAKPSGGAWAVKAQPSRLVNGSPILFEVTPPQPLKSLAGTWLGHDVFFFTKPDSRSWWGLAGVGVDTQADSYLLELHGTPEQGTAITFAKKVHVGKAKYPHIAVTVPTKFTEPSPAELKEIAAAREIKTQVLSHVGPDREWSGDFAAPVKANISDIFGTARTFNGKVQGVHQGLDYGVPQGTPVMAANHGTVLLAQPLYFEGNCVMIDHGQGLLTIFMHLSRIDVKKGDAVERGKQLGLSGGTGQATGPHLHFAVRWQGVYVDPAKLLELKISLGPTSDDVP